MYLRPTRASFDNPESALDGGVNGLGEAISIVSGDFERQAGFVQLITDRQVAQHLRLAMSRLVEGK